MVNAEQRLKAPAIAAGGRSGIPARSVPIVQENLASPIPARER
jgi:hypothetical protein